MDWTQIITGVLSTLGATAVLVPVCAWFLKLYVDKRVQHEYNVKLADHKLHLDKQLAMFAAHTTQVTTRRVQVLLDAYRHMSKAARNSSAMVDVLQLQSNDPDVEKKKFAENAKLVADNLNSFCDAVWDNRPLIAWALYATMDEFAKKMRNVWYRGVCGREGTHGTTNATKPTILFKRTGHRCARRSTPQYVSWSR